MAAVVATRAGMVLDGRYRLDGRLAGGGMADVWRGTDELLGRAVAVKILSPRLAADDVDRQRFREEARTAAQLSHAGIAAVHDFGEAYPEPLSARRPGDVDDLDDEPGRLGGSRRRGRAPGPGGSGPGGSSGWMPSGEGPVPYLVMELVEGQSLAGLLKGGPLGTGLTIDLVVQTAWALEYAHRNGVVHRDVKPANLMVTPQYQVKVTDFGIARRHGHEPLTATGLLIGTPDYLAPEISRGASATPQSDIYALGVVAYECLAGRRPFIGDSNVAILTAHVEQQPQPLPPTVPAEVAAAVMTALQKDPRRRFASAAALAATLDRLRVLPEAADPTVAMVRPPIPMHPGTRRTHAPLPTDLTAAPPAAPGVAYGSGGYDGEPADEGYEDPGRPRPLRQFALLLTIAALMGAGFAAMGSGQALTLLNRLMPAGAAGSASAPGPGAAATGTPAGAAESATSVSAPGTGVAAIGTPSSMPAAAPSPSAATGGQGTPSGVLTVPDLAGRSVTRARNLLSAAGFRVGDTSRADGTAVTAGRVVRTDPAAGAEAPAQSRVDLYVVAEGVNVPDLTGHPVGDAVDILHNQLRMDVTVRYQQSDQPAGTVVGQDVRGTVVPPGSRVTLTVSGQGRWQWQAGTGDPSGGQTGQANGQTNGQTNGTNAGPTSSGQHW